MSKNVKIVKKTSFKKPTKSVNFDEIDELIHESQIPDELIHESQFSDTENDNNSLEDDYFINHVIKTPCMIVIAGKSKRGKSYLIKYIITMLGIQKKFKFGLVFVKTKFNGGYDYFDSNKVIEGYNERLLRNYLNTLKEYGEKNPVTPEQKLRGVRTNIPPSLIVFDDIIGNVDLNSGIMSQFLTTYRHYNITVICAVQYIFKIPPVFREQVDIAVMFEQSTEKSIKALYESYGQHFETFKKWKDFLMEYTNKPFHCLIFNEDGDDNDRYFRYKAPSAYPDVTFKF